MAKLPDTIIRGMKGRIGLDKTARYDDVVAEFLNNGYGRNKARKWIDLYTELGVIRNEYDDRVSISFFSYLMQ